MTQLLGDQISSSPFLFLFLVFNFFFLGTIFKNPENIGPVGTQNLKPPISPPQSLAT